MLINFQTKTTVTTGKDLTRQMLDDVIPYIDSAKLRQLHATVKAFVEALGPVTRIECRGTANGKTSYHTKLYWLGDNADPAAPDLVLTAAAVGVAGFPE